MHSRMVAGLLEVRQPPHTQQHRGQTEHGPAREMLHAKGLEPGACRKDRDQKTHGAPQAHPPVTLGVKSTALAHEVRHGRFAHGHHGTGVGEHEQQDQAQPHRSPIQKQQTSGRKSHTCANAQQLHALARAVTQSPPGIGRKQSGGGLHGGEHTDGQEAQPHVLQPQRQIGVEKPDVGEITGRQRGKRQELTALRHGSSNAQWEAAPAAESVHTAASQPFASRGSLPQRGTHPHAKASGLARWDRGQIVFDIPTLGTVLQGVLHDHQRQHGLCDRRGADAHARVMAAFGDDFGGLAC